MSGDEGFDRFEERLEVPMNRDFDSLEWDLVPTELKKLEIDDERHRQMVLDEDAAFERLKELIEGSWTERFAMKRMKVKVINAVFFERVGLLNAVRKEDHFQTTATLRVCNVLSVYTFDHQSVLKRLLDIAEKWHFFENTLEELVADFVQIAVNEELRGEALRGSVRSSRMAMLHAVAMVFALDIDGASYHGHYRYPDSQRVVGLHAVVDRITSTMYRGLNAVSVSMKRSEKVLDRQMAAILSHLQRAHSRTNPIGKEEIYDFRGMVKAQKLWFEKLLIPKQFMLDLMPPLLPSLKVMTEYVERISMEFLMEFIQYLMHELALQFDAEKWETLRTRYGVDDERNIDTVSTRYSVGDMEIDQEPQDRKADADGEWLAANLAKTTVTMSHELGALNKLLAQQVVAESKVTVRCSRTSSSADATAYLVEVADQGPSLKMMLFYDEADGKIIRELTMTPGSRKGIEHNPEMGEIHFPVSGSAWGWLSSDTVTVKFPGEFYQSMVATHLRPKEPLLA